MINQDQPNFRQLYRSKRCSTRFFQPQHHHGRFRTVLLAQGQQLPGLRALQKWRVFYIYVCIYKYN